MSDPAPGHRLVLSYPADRPLVPCLAVSRLARFAGDSLTALVADMVERAVRAGELPEEEEVRGR